MSEKRDDFSDATRQIIKRQAGGCCARCEIKTTDHNGEGEKPLTTGEAAHIKASSEGGPRFDSENSSEFRRSSENGIWLCSECHVLVDTGNLQLFDTRYLWEKKWERGRLVCEAVLKSTKPSDDQEKAFWLVDSHGANIGTYGIYDAAIFDLVFSKSMICDEWKFKSKKLNTLLNVIQKCDYSDDQVKQYLYAIEIYSKTKNMDLVSEAVRAKVSENIA